MDAKDCKSLGAGSRVVAPDTAKLIKQPSPLLDSWAVIVTRAFPEELTSTVAAGPTRPTGLVTSP
jgi:hypothetical protein